MNVGNILSRNEALLRKRGYPFHIPSANPTAKLEANGRRATAVERKAAIWGRDVETASISFS